MIEKVYFSDLSNERLDIHFLRDINVYNLNQKMGFLLVDLIIDKIGDKIKRMRKDAGLSLREFSRMTGVAPSTIQKIETKRMIPSISILMKIAQGLNKSINYFIEEGSPGTEVQLIRKIERKISYNAHCKMFVEDLGANVIDPLFNGIVLRIKVGGGSDGGELSHRGEELVYTLKGKVEFNISGERYLLGRGDCLHFKSVLPHSWRNAGKTEAELIVITSPPWFS